MQGGKQDKTCHLVLELNFNGTSVKMGKEAMVGSLIIKHSRRTKAKMAMFKVKKTTTKEVREVKKLAK